MYNSIIVHKYDLLGFFNVTSTVLKLYSWRKSIKKISIDKMGLWVGGTEGTSKRRWQNRFGKRCHIACQERLLIIICFSSRTTNRVQTMLEVHHSLNPKSISMILPGDIGCVFVRSAHQSSYVLFLNYTSLGVYKYKIVKLWNIQCFSGISNQNPSVL